MTYKRANGTGSVYKLSGRRRKPWIACVTIGWEEDPENPDKVRQKVYIIGTYRTRNEGLIALAEYNKLPFSTDNANMTMNDIYEYWLKTAAKQKAKGTLVTYRSAYNKLKVLHDTPYRLINISQVESLIADATPSTKGQVHAIVKFLDATAIKLDIPIKNISQGMSQVPQAMHAPKKLFTEEEIDKLWSVVKTEPFAKVVLVYLYTGLRKSELITIRKENVDLKNWTMTGGIKTAAGMNRVVPIHSRIRPIIKKMYQESRSDLLYGISKDKVHEYFKRTMKDLKMDHIIHETRHTFRTRLYNAGVDRLIIDKLCGHKSAGSIGESVYTHLSVEQMKDAIEKLR